VVVIKYLTTGIEAKPLVNKNFTSPNNFFWQNIIYRFGVPREITIENAKKFDCDLFKDLCYHLGAEATFTSVYYP
jgi:hypothetical protein